MNQFQLQSLLVISYLDHHLIRAINYLICHSHFKVLPFFIHHPTIKVDLNHTKAVNFLHYLSALLKF